MWVKVVMAETIWLGVWGRECNIVERSAWRVGHGGRLGSYIIARSGQELYIVLY